MPADLANSSTVFMNILRMRVGPVRVVTAEDGGAIVMEVLVSAVPGR